MYFIQVPPLFRGIGRDSHGNYLLKRFEHFLNIDQPCALLLREKTGEGRGC
jgi:hypothetical protein